jgi:hypothetical protein
MVKAGPTLNRVVGRSKTPCVQRAKNSMVPNPQSRDGRCNAAA